MSTTNRLLLISILALFILVRLPGLYVPYYQDEAKTVLASEISLVAASTFLSHPPLTALFFRADAIVFGGTYMRVLPLLFGLLSALLLFAVVRRMFDERTALWSLALYAVSFYGVWASLMIDTDGAILPTFFLASVYCYNRLLEDSNRKFLWSGLLALSLITGLFVKLSFVLVFAALLGDFFIRRYRSMERRHLVVASIGALGFVILCVGAFAIVQIINPAFQLGSMIAHAQYYMHLSDRNYLQVVVQAVKALYYLSPLLLLPLLFLSSDILKRARVLLLYLGLGFIFYFILFDFSRGALDKYLMFTIIPLCILSGAAIARVWTAPLSISRMWIGISIVSALAVLGGAFATQTVVPLYPKSAWFISVLHGHLNVLTPFNGGSGPLGFYVSFLSIFLGFLASAVAVGIGFFIPRWRQGAVLVVLLVGLSYNALFIEEFSFGKINGSAPDALRSSLAFIQNSDKVDEIITYNDVGAYELSHMGKYAGRFYAVPAFEAGHEQRFAAYTGQFLVVGIPPLYDGFYSRYFAKCASLFQTKSGVITSTVYTCGQPKN